MNKLLLAAAAACFAAGSVNAAEIVQTSSQLAAANSTNFLYTVSTTTNADGRTTTANANSPFPASTRYTESNAPKDVWRQQNVGGRGVAGITNAYARSGDGSAFFSGVDGNSKADLEINFSQAVPLSQVTSLSYDAYRDSSSTAPAHQVNSLRLILGNAAGVSVGTYLIFEPVYNEFPTANPLPADVWNTFSITDDTRVYANNGNLNMPAGTGECPRCSSFTAWKSANPTLTVIGLSTGSGSGWSGTYRGAVDNVNFTTTTASMTWNFEVAATAAVPEPASWALMIGGVGLTGGVLRRRRGAVLAAA